MKKIFTLVATVVVAMSASAQDAAKENVYKTLDKGLVMYLTSDVTTQKKSIVTDEDTGEEIEKVVDNPWTASAMANNFNDAGIGLGSNTEDIGVQIKMKQDYVDAETGFTIKTGQYRGVSCNKARFSLEGSLDATRTFKGFKNLGSVVLYFAPIPVTMSESPALEINDFPTGRVEAQYLNEDATALSNLAYREVHITQTVDPEYSVEEIPPTSGNWVTHHNVKGCDLVGFERDANDNTKISIDRPLKVTVNLKNEKDVDYYETIFASDTKKGEFTDVTLKTEPDATMDYYFGTKSEIWSYANESDYKDDADKESRRGEGNGTATGYSLLDGRWSTKLAWSETLPIKVAVKYRMYLLGMALVSGTNPTQFQYFDGSGVNAQGIQDKNMCAYGATGGADAIQEAVVSSKVAPRKQLVNGQIVIGDYNIAGQRVK